MTAPSWRDRAACLGQDVDRYIPDGRDIGSEEARQLCAGCTVKNECLATAIEGRELGVWGGTTQDERAAMRRERERRRSKAAA